jgi:acyl carrier protein
MNVRQEFLDIFQDYVDFPVSEVPTDKPFKATSGLDSFVFIEMISAVEEHFNIRIPNSDLLGFQTLDDMIHYIEGKTAQAALA